MAKRICLVGFSEINRAWTMDQPDDVEIWGLNEGHNCTQRLMSVDDLGREKKFRCPCYNPRQCKCEKHGHEFIPRYDRWFQVHPAEWKQEERISRAAKTGDKIHEKDLDAFGRNERHVKFLRECDQPLYMLNIDTKWGPFPNAIEYPLAEIEEKLGIPWSNRKYLYSTSSPSYMIALAIHEHLKGDSVEEILMAGIELSIGTEYFWQRPCMEYYLGMATGLGIKVTMPPMGGSLLRAPRYAIDDPLPLPKDFTHEAQPIYQPTNEEAEEHGEFVDVQTVEEAVSVR